MKLINNNRSAKLNIIVVNIKQKTIANNLKK